VALTPLGLRHHTAVSERHGVASHEEACSRLECVINQTPKPDARRCNESYGGGGELAMVALMSCVLSNQMAWDAACDMDPDCTLLVDMTHAVCDEEEDTKQPTAEDDTHSDTCAVLVQPATTIDAEAAEPIPPPNMLPLTLPVVGLLTGRRADAAMCANAIACVPLLTIPLTLITRGRVEFSALHARACRAVIARQLVLSASLTTTRCAPKYRPTASALPDSARLPAPVEGTLAGARLLSSCLSTHTICVALPPAAPTITATRPIVPLPELVWNTTAESSTRSDRAHRVAPAQERPDCAAVNANAPPVAVTVGAKGCFTLAEATPLIVAPPWLSPSETAPNDPARQSRSRALCPSRRTQRRSGPKRQTRMRSERLPTPQPAPSR
jgi:hypothetical protein